MILSVLSLFIYILNSAFGYLQIYEDDLIKTSLVQNLSSTIKNNSMNFKNVIKSNTNENNLNYDNSIEPVWNAWNSVKNSVDSSQDIFFQIESIRYGLIAYIDTTTSAINSMYTDQKLFSEQTLKAMRIDEYISGYLHLLINLRLEESTKLHEDQKEKVSKIRVISFITIAVIGIVCLLFSNFFSKTLTNPIINLAKNSRLMAKGNLNVKTIKATSNDEIGVLTNSFNDMSQSISLMVESLKDKAKIEKQHFEDEVKLIDMGKSLKEAQFLSLQSQINPHFLFNTLNTIARTSMFEQATKTVRLIESLSSIFRYNLNNQEKSVTLKEELEIVDEYMFIQKTRYGNRINFNIHNNIKHTNVKIPIFTLQPLIENAVKHGIEPKEEGGDISIIINKSNEYVVIKIVDTGVGFDLNKIKEVKDESTSIGLMNVQKRLALKFNGQQTFNINSEVSYGTTITITIPEEIIV